MPGLRVFDATSWLTLNKNHFYGTSFTWIRSSFGIFVNQEATESTLNTTREGFLDAWLEWKFSKTGGH
jgi:hypothetical protein